MIKLKLEKPDFVKCHHKLPDQDGRCFLTAWAMSKSVIAAKHDRMKPNFPKQKGVYPS